MTFPVLSTSTETAATKRAIRVLKRLEVAQLVDHAGVFNCRTIAGSTAWSDHAFGAAADLFPRADGGDLADKQRREIAHALVYQSTHRTKANRGRKLVTRYVIDHDGRAIWTPALGWHAYGGTTGNHVHGSFGPAPQGTPACAS